MSNSSAFPENHPRPTSKANTCSLTKVNPHWSTGKHTCAATTTSTPTKNEYIIQKSASTTATTSTSDGPQYQNPMVGGHNKPPSPNPSPSNNTVPSNRVKSEEGHTSGKRKGQTKNMGKALMCLRCGRNSHTKYYCKDYKVSCRHCKSQIHACHCCAFIPKATSTSNGETSDTASTSR